MKEYNDYFSYLRKRSTLGYFYRKFWLYPFICSHVHGRVLDVGCGIGDMLSYRPESVGVDINPATVKFCQGRGLNAFLMEKDRLPFSNEVFDSIILDNVLEHIEKPLPLLAEIKRVLKKNGILIIGVPGRKGYKSDPDHKIFYDEKMLENVSLKSRFTLEKFFYLPVKLKVLDGVMKQFCIYALLKKFE
jgi:SAM-dependent methyltransferase